MIHTDDSFIPIATASQISKVSDDLLHKLKKKSEAVPNRLKHTHAPKASLCANLSWQLLLYVHTRLPASFGTVDTSFIAEARGH
jgi:hypothetical protein